MGIPTNQPYMPKFGEVCEAVDYDCGNDEYYQRVIFIGDNPKDKSEGSFKVFSCLNDGCLFWSDKFRPLKTEREKFIDKSMSIFDDLVFLPARNKDLENLFGLQFDKGARFENHDE